MVRVVAVAMVVVLVVAVVSLKPPHHYILNILNKYNPQTNKTTPDMIRDNGYPAETHHVTTEDGYILELHRIPYGIHSRVAPEPRPVAFLHHCLLCSSSDFIMNTPDKALGYILADVGFDVWLTNARGNTYSRSHTTLSPEYKEFWDFSWHEMGVYDLPAALDYVLEKTRQSQVYYIGFSMGTTVFWVLMSERPEYAQKVRFMAALGPVAYVEHMDGPMAYAAPFSSHIKWSLSLIGKHELLSFGPIMDRLVGTFCDQEVFTSSLCYNTLYLITGPNPTRINKEYLPVTLAHTPAGTSVSTLTHFFQLVTSGEFCQYDHGRLVNLRHYGSLSPPKYDLKKVTTPLALFWSDGDWLADPQDVLRLTTELPNVVYNHHVDDPTFTHLDFAWAMDATKLVYRYLLEALVLH